MHGFLHKKLKIDVNVDCEATPKTSKSTNTTSRCVGYLYVIMNQEISTKSFSFAVRWLDYGSLWFWLWLARTSQSSSLGLLAGSYFLDPVSITLHFILPIATSFSRSPGFSFVYGSIVELTVWQLSEKPTLLHPEYMTQPSKTSLTLSLSTFCKIIHSIY